METISIQSKKLVDNKNSITSNKINLIGYLDLSVNNYFDNDKLVLVKINWVNSSYIIKKLKASFVYLILLTFLINNFSCTAIKERFRLDEQIYGYFTFSLIELIVNDDEDITIELGYLFHTKDKLEISLISQRIQKELIGIAQKSEFKYQITGQSELGGSIKFFVESYSSVNTFFENLKYRLNEITINPNNFPMPIFNAKLAHESTNNLGIFTFSRGFFEPGAHISIQAKDGELALNGGTSSIFPYNIADNKNNIEYVFRPNPKDSLLRDKTETIGFTFKKQDPPWYSLESIAKIFKSDPSKPPPSEESKHIPTSTSSKDAETNIGILSWINERLNWIATILIPILTFIGITNLEKITAFFKRFFFNSQRV